MSGDPGIVATDRCTAPFEYGPNLSIRFSDIPVDRQDGKGVENRCDLTP